MLCLQTSDFLNTLTCYISEKALGGCFSKPAGDRGAFFLLGDQIEEPKFQSLLKIRVP